MTYNIFSIQKKNKHSVHHGQCGGLTLHIDQRLSIGLGYCWSPFHASVLITHEN
jgi:hypothetical protein